MKARFWLASAIAASLLPMVPRSPAGASVTYTGNGFDTCAAPALDVMAAWLASPYRSLGIYIGGANRACGDGNLSASWVGSVESEGYNLVPTYVGLQAPCVNQPGLATIDPANAVSEGTSAADDAVARAQNFGLGLTTPIYFDMEAYGSDPNCITTVTDFVSAWVTEVHRLGFLAGIYGSSASTIANEAALYGNPSQPRLDDIWFANWNGTPNIFGDPYFSDSTWPNHQRLHQFQGGHDETYGGQTINIDSDYDDGAVACMGGGAANVCWSGPGSVGSGSGPGRVTGTVYAVSSAPTRIDLFWRGADANLWTAWYSDATGWNTPTSLGGGPLGSDPHPVSSALGRIDVFWRGTDKGLWHEWKIGGGWYGPETLGGRGNLPSEPQPVSPASTSIEVLWRGTDAAIWHASYKDGIPWSLPSSLGGGPVGSDPHPAASGGGAISVFWRGLDANLWELSNQGSGWAGPTFLGSGPLGSDPHPLSSAAGRVDVFWRGTDSGLWHDWSNGGRQWGPASLGGAGTLTTDPVPVSPDSTHIGVFWRGPDNGSLHWAHYGDGMGWTIPVSLGGGPIGDAAQPVSSAKGRIDTFWPGTDSGVWHLWVFGA